MLFKKKRYAFYMELTIKNLELHRASIEICHPHEEIGELASLKIYNFVTVTRLCNL